MLTSIREKATGWIAWLIVIFITIPFALWGINSYFEGATEIAVAEVNGVEISAETYQQELALQRQALTSRLGGNVDPELLDSLGIKNRVVEGLVDNQLLREYTEDRNFRISDQHLSRIIQNYDAFQRDGRFSEELYTRLLQSNRMTPQVFEQSQRLTESIAQLRDGIDLSSFTVDAELERLLSLDGQSRISEYVRLGADSFMDEFEITEDEIRAHYDKNIERYQNEARMKVDYIELSVGELAETIELTEEELLAHYEDTSGRYRQAESRKASHILFSAAEDADEATRKEKLDLALEVLERAEQGEDFAELARQYSEDPGSSRNGGDLGTIARGQMVKPFEDAVYSMIEGDISGPVETRFGYHVIKLTSLDPGQQQSFEEARERVAEDAKSMQAERLFAELAESFKNLVFESPEDINVSAEELGLEVLGSDWFTADRGEGIAQEAVVRRAAFSEDVLTDNLVSQAIELGFDRLVAVQKSVHEPRAPRPLETVSEDIVLTLKREKSQAKVFQQGSGFLSELEAAPLDRPGWEEFARAQGLEIEALPEQRADIPPELAYLGDSVFSAAAPEEGKLRAGGLALENGDYAIFVLEDISPGTTDESDPAQRTRIEQQLLARDGFGLYNQFREMLKDDASIVIFEDQL